MALIPPIWQQRALEGGRREKIAPVLYAQWTFIVRKFLYISPKAAEKFPLKCTFAWVKNGEALIAPRASLFSARRVTGELFALRGESAERRIVVRAPEIGGCERESERALS